MIRAIREAHLYGRKLYLTVNTLIKEREMKERLFSFLKPFYENGLDAVLVQDLGALAFIREQFPDLAIHASTQMSVAGALGAGFLKQYGVERVVPARELSLAEIRKMKEETGLEIECFVQGRFVTPIPGSVFLAVCWEDVVGTGDSVLSRAV